MITFLPALAALAVLRRAPQHRPIAAALWLAGAIEVARPHLGARAALAVMLALPALSAWSSGRALLGVGMGKPAIAVWAMAAALVLGLARPSSWWSWPWPVAFGLGAFLEVLFVVIWWRRGRLLTVTQETALVLVGGDLGALIARCCFGVEGWPAWSEGVAVLATGLQIRWLLFQRWSRPSS